MDCVFCKIAAGEIPSQTVYEDEFCRAFHDIAPQAPVHVLLIPKKHIASLATLSEEDAETAAALLQAIPKVAALLPLGEGFRVVSNAGKHGCQSVSHLHFHILGGKQLAAEMA